VVLICIKTNISCYFVYIKIIFKNSLIGETRIVCRYRFLTISEKFGWGWYVLRCSDERVDFVHTTA